MQLRHTTAAATDEPTSPVAATPVAEEASEPTAAEADAFVARAERELAEFSVLNARAQWVNSTYITPDTDALAAHFGTIGTEMGVRLATEAARFQNVEGLSYDTRRKLDILRAGLTLPAPTTEGAAAELNRISTDLQSQYGRGRGTMNGETLTGNEIEARMGTVRDPEDLKEMWTSWNTNVGAPMRPQYARLVEIANAGARELGFADTGAMWRSNSDMPPEEFAALTERLWNEVRPLYEEIHCFTRAGLNRTYGDQVQPETGPIRADLLGNLWAQEWGNVYEVVAPRGASGNPPYDLTELLERADYTPERIVRQGESFFSSLGFAPLPQSFWERSMITQPRDREVICHASAWDVDNVDDLRIKMCTRVNADDFITVHHELGHNYYQRAYNQQPFLYLNSANDGFHEAIGDMIALSVTPEYLVQIGLLQENRLPTPEQDRAAFRRGRQISRAGKRSLHPLLPRPDPPVPVLQGGLRHCRLAGAASPLLLLRQSRSGPAVERDAGDGRVEALARRPRGLHRNSRNVGRADDRIFPAAARLASRAEPGTPLRLVRRG